MNLHLQYITDNHGHKVSVVLPIRDYEKILEQLDEIECIKAYDKAKSHKHEFLPADEVFKQIETKRTVSNV